MKKILPFAISGLLGSSLAGTVVAADLVVKVEVPTLNVAAYHRPYVAIWIEKNDQSFVSNLSVWYDLKKRNHEGEKWLKDMRQWWRRSGRDLTMPMDGLSGATRVAGEHTMVFSGKSAALTNLAAGDYKVIVEAAREDGGREVVKVPFTWGGKTLATNTEKGSHELGAVSVSVK